MRSVLLTALVLAVGPAFAAPVIAGGTASPVDKAMSLEDVLVRDAPTLPSACPSLESGDLPEGDRRAGAATDRSLPPRTDGPTPVDVFMFVLAIDAIDPATNSFRFEGFGGLVWCDRRLAFDAAAVGSDRRQYFAEAARAELIRNWWPAVAMPTRIGEAERSSEHLVIHADGTIRFTLKFNTRLAAQFDYRDFPLDSQRLVLPLQSLVYRADQVDLRAAPELSGFDPAFDVPEWTLLETETRVVDRELQGGGAPFRRFQTEILMSRKAGFYVWKVAIPIAIVMAVSWSVFWMTRDVLAQRQRQSATAILTLVAFQFVAAGFLPRVSYLTFLDAVILWSFCAIALTLLLNSWNVHGFRQDPEIGLRRDRLWRWLYPLVYFAGVAISFLERWLDAPH